MACAVAVGFFDGVGVEGGDAEVAARGARAMGRCTRGAGLVRGDLVACAVALNAYFQGGRVGPQISNTGSTRKTNRPRSTRPVAAAALFTAGGIARSVVALHRDQGPSLNSPVLQREPSGANFTGVAPRSPQDSDKELDYLFLPIPRDIGEVNYLI